MRRTLLTPASGFLPRLRPLTTSAPRPDRPPASSSPSSSSWEGYLPDTLDAPLHSLPVPAPSPQYLASLSSGHSDSSSSASSSSSITRDETLAKARIVFGTKLGGPAARPPAPHLDPRSQLIAGVHVPPKPEEPDNCCMSGCAHCVWDRWREEMEVWAAARREVEVKMKETEGRTVEGGKEEGGEKAEGRGGRTKGRGEEDELFGDVPVGIREFMRLEKKLKGLQGG